LPNISSLRMAYYQPSITLHQVMITGWSIFWLQPNFS